jgi:hypothetical protein
VALPGAERLRRVPGPVRSARGLISRRLASRSRLEPAIHLSEPTRKLPHVCPAH